MTELNGWNIEAMNKAIDGVKEQPEAGKLTWRSRVDWDSGYGLDVRTREIKQLGQVIQRPFTLRGDHPPELLGNNTGPTAVEILMSALGACMAGTFAAQATAHGIRIKNLKLDLESMMDLNGMFGLKPIRPGIFNVKLLYHLDSDADISELKEILNEVKSLSPVFDSVTKPVKVDVDLNKV